MVTLHYFDLLNKLICLFRSTVAGDEMPPMSTQTSMDATTEKDSYHSFEANDAPETPPPSSSSNLPLVRYEQCCQLAKFDPFLSLDCARTEGKGAQSKERKGSNFAA